VIIALKDVELKLLSELMKNSKRSDRELAQTIGVSQPTISRTRTKLEKEGYIKEYTMIPDFSKLGFELMAITFVKFKKVLSDEQMIENRKMAEEIQKEMGYSSIMVMSAAAQGYDRAIISFHKDYSSLVKFTDRARTVPFIDLKDIINYVIPMTDVGHFQPLTLSKLANKLLQMKEKE
jgi:DNA-binding Lrp family transcriptional regulator